MASVRYAARPPPPREDLQDISVLVYIYDPETSQYREVVVRKAEKATWQQQLREAAKLRDGEELKPVGLGRQFQWPVVRPIIAYISAPLAPVVEGLQELDLN